MSSPFLLRSRDQRVNFFLQNRELLKFQAKEGQTPKALFIGCSDSRLMPESLFAFGPGEFFMLRNIANIVPPYWHIDVNIASILEFAVLELKVPDIIVCGHTDCGGIKALEEGIAMDKYPALARWLEFARPAFRDVEQIAPESDPSKKHELIVERNIAHQVSNLGSYPYIRQAISDGKLRINGWLYDLEKLEIRYFKQTEGIFITV